MCAELDPENVTHLFMQILFVIILRTNFIINLRGKLKLMLTEESQFGFLKRKLVNLLQYCRPDGQR